MDHKLIQGNFTAVKKTFADLTAQLVFDPQAIKINCDRHFTKEETALLQQTVMSMKSWRKGPYYINDFYINSEWRDYIKWQRIAPFCTDLRRKTVADVGCSNGYFMFNLLRYQPEKVIGFDPFQICKYQFDFLNYFVKAKQLEFMLKQDLDLADFSQSFDLILYMGVLYHRRDPVQSLKILKDALKPQGKMLIETMILPGESPEPVEIKDRYSLMKNVYYLTTIHGLQRWLEEAGFSDYKLISVSQTSTFEQRTSEYAPFISLEGFLNPENPLETVEGYPGPRRLIIEASL